MCWSIHGRYSAMPSKFTGPFQKVFDALRFVTKPISKPSSDPLKIYTRAGVLITTLTAGWFDDIVAAEDDFEETLKLYVTDRTGVAFSQAKFFVFRGFRYEAKGFPSYPKDDPQLWVWTLKPVGVEQTAFVALRVSETHYLTTATDAPLQVSE